MQSAKTRTNVLQLDSFAVIISLGLEIYRKSYIGPLKDMLSIRTLYSGDSMKEVCPAVIPCPIQQPAKSGQSCFCRESPTASLHALRLDLEQPWVREGHLKGPINFGHSHVSSRANDMIMGRCTQSGVTCFNFKNRFQSNSILRLHCIWRKVRKAMRGSRRQANTFENGTSCGPRIVVRGFWNGLLEGSSYVSQT